MSDDFKQTPGLYLAHRPTYPRALFEWLATASPRCERAWDCATGAGQAAVGLAEFFDSVLATDINQEQIEHAVSHPRIAYVVAPAEHSALPDATIDLITVACGVHWFDRDAFYQTAKRVLTPDGVLALWTYIWPWTGSKAVDEVLARLKEEVLHGHWPEVSSLYLSGYREMEFPFQELAVPSFSLECAWDADALMGFLSTWSAAQRYLRQNGTSPLQLIEEELRTAWKFEPPRMPILLPLHFRVGRNLRSQLA